MLSLGIDCALAARIAARSRAFASGSGRPILAATVISRDSLENIAERFLSCAPLRYMMFLYLLCPAMVRLNQCAHVELVETRALTLRQAQGERKWQSTRDGAPGDRFPATRPAPAGC